MALRRQITLEDWKSALADMERIFKLPKVEIPLDGILKKRDERKVFESLVDLVIGATDGTTEADLRKILARSLQIIPFLPTKDPDLPPKVTRSTRRADRRLNARIRRFAEELQRLDMRERGRRRIYLELLGLPDNFRMLPELLRQYADLRERMYAHTRLKDPNPNPQLRWAQYILNFFYIVLGNRPWSDMASLIHATFEAVGKHPPKWADGERLRQEMGRRERRWRRMIGLSHTP